MLNQPRGGHIFNIDGAGSDGRPTPRCHFCFLQSCMMNAWFMFLIVHCVQVSSTCCAIVQSFLVSCRGEQIILYQLINLQSLGILVLSFFSFFLQICCVWGNKTQCGAFDEIIAGTCSISFIDAFFLIFVSCLDYLKAFYT